MVETTGDPEGRGVLDATARAMLDLEAKPFKYAGAKQEAIRSTLHMSSAAYHQRLNVLIDSETAYSYAPMLVARLRRDRDQRAAAAGAPQRRPEDAHR